MGTLYECLREAKLEKYYQSFRAQGITKSDALMTLTTSDYPAFGITSADDKKRLLELINIIKAVHNVTERNDYCVEPPTSSKAVQSFRNKSPRKRNRSPAQTPLQVAGRALSASNDVHVNDRSRTKFNAGIHHLPSASGAILDLVDDEESEQNPKEHSEYEPATKHSVTASVVRELPGRISKMPVEKVKYGAGYNYGVPGTGAGARPKSRSTSTRLNEDRIKVCVRKRPLSKREIKNGEEDMIQAASTTTVVVSEPKQAVDLTAYTLQHEFIFDEVFEESCTNEDVYIRAARPLISCIFDGGSATCFAYGQTGAGKTHTMIGNREVPGLYLLAAHDIFSIIESGQYGVHIKVWVSFFEIYCGQLFDLLNKRNRLHAREDGSNRVCIAGLTETEATDEESLMQVLDYGNSVRSKGATGVNQDSSRSHAVLQMEIRDETDKRLGRFPLEREDIDNVKLGFYRRCRIPNVVGAVDGTLVPILAPTTNPDIYICRKGYHALNIQAVVDSNMRFIDAVCKWPGSQHDAAIFDSCGLKEHLETSNIGHLLGDSGYPLRHFLLTPVASPSRANEVRFNKAHGRGRVVIEKAFGILKARFRVSFIDLAGSERASDSTDTDKQTRMEGAEINQSLLALKECIRSIDQESKHKPFRQSKLTHILKDSFIGNSKTCMIANISPGSSSCEHTLNTLRYADRVKELRRGVQSSPSTSRSANVAMSNILMNIPASAPSIFQPSNILCSSTPMRQSGRHYKNRNTAADLHLDPSETPIRGPGVKRITSSAVSRNESKTQKASLKGAVTNFEPTQHFSETSLQSAGNKNDIHVSSNSESDQTESDSCNVTGPKKSVNVPAQILNIENKLVNKKKSHFEKSVFKSACLDGEREAIISSQNIPVIKSSDMDSDFLTTDFNNEEELNDLNRTGGMSNIAASVPVFPSNTSRQSEVQCEKNTKKEQTTGCAQSRYSSLSASVPVLRKKIYTENQADSENNIQSSKELFQNEQGQNDQTSTKTSVNTTNSEHKSELNPRSTGKVTSKSTDKSIDIEITGEDSPRLIMQSASIDSFNEELLFDTPSVDQRVWTPRTPRESSRIQPRIPQDPSSEPEIPAVLPAKSTELTTFSQSPRWHLNKNQNNYPLLAQQTSGFKPEPICTIPKEKVNSKNQVTALPRSVHNSNYRKNDPQQRQVIPKSAENKPVITPNQDLSIKKPGLSNDIFKISVLTADSEHREEKKEEIQPISANWFMTPADHETHVAESVSQRSDEFTSKKSPLHKCDNENLKSNIDEQDLALGKTRFVHSDNSILSAISDSECKRSHFVRDVINKQNRCASGYTNSNFSKSGYFSDLDVRNTSDGFVAKHHLVHSPVTLRHNSNTSPVIKDYVSISPTDEVSANSSLHFDGDICSTSTANKKSDSVIFKTEKLQVVSAFSPIHPQPVTRSNESRSIAVCKDILHPTPLSTVSASVNVQPTLHVSDKASEVIDLKSQLITFHEDQLATVTSLCKQEMKLLLGAKAGNKKFDDYMKKVSEVLTQKLAAIQLLQDQIIAYQLSTQDSGLEAQVTES